MSEKTLSPQQKAAETRKKKAAEKVAQAEQAVKDPLLAGEIEQDELETEDEEIESEESESDENVTVEEKNIPMFDPTKKDKAAVKAEKEKLSEVEQHKADLERFKKEIEKGPKTMFMIPLDQGEKAGAVQVVSLNGVSFTIKKGAMVTIPVAIAEVLAEKYEVEMTAGKEMLADRNDSTSEALS
ncbi:MAG: hypothetical protein ACD_5C00016G0003 [uncultured bacterium]|nr:MAG: hypothetical protein ACD_5C00016G0003 [uncultured bacterium]